MTAKRQPRWKFLGFDSAQQYAGQVGANKRRISKINGLLSALGWPGEGDSEEADILHAEKDRLVDQIAPLPKLFPLPVLP